ncbi:hypothetical protein BCR32DRAFT_38270 [Anaeromyces robustus]|uniref:CBM10 domain-containing protein n=1 Tax=Anaeromyces robustus TaxID=1754192 RepID=A0A1Y1X015_9FUNG|nr:hypothetical protein BCR32DRAFT_38270 [Anaeromyces robustus]|eukprot:ORX79140.1 hypothetical protein BCR32DRAFT_38270 [Anaeromyces robustus]
MKYIFGFLIISSLIFNSIETNINYNYCTSCQIYATGKDGSLWGWENDNPCKIRNKCISNNNTNKTNNNNSSTTNNVNTNNNNNNTNNTNNNNNNTINNNDAVVNNEAQNKESLISDNTLTQNITVTENQNQGQGQGQGQKQNNNNKTISKLFEDVTVPLRDRNNTLICSFCDYERKIEDTSLWAVENGEDCRVVGSICSINTTPHPWCSGCVVTGTGGESSLYGWEHNAPCLIDENVCNLATNRGGLQYDPRFNKTARLIEKSGINPKDYYHPQNLITLLIIFIVTMLIF